MQTLWQDSALRIPRAAKVAGFTSIAVLSLALGIGANTALFSMVTRCCSRS